MFTFQKSKVTDDLSASTTLLKLLYVVYFSTFTNQSASRARGGGLA